MNFWNNKPTAPEKTQVQPEKKDPAATNPIEKKYTKIVESKPKPQSAQQQPQPTDKPLQNQPPQKQDSIGGFFSRAGQAVSNAFSGSKDKKPQSENDDQQTQYNTEYSMIQHDDDNEGQNNGMEDEFFKNLFKSKEVDFKSHDPNDASSKERLGVDILKDAVEINLKDLDGRMILHRAALEQRPDILRQSIQIIDTLPLDQRHRIIEEKDKYQNTPLLLCAVYDHAHKRSNRFECMKVLLSKGALANVQNPSTQFTPLHWACIHGATDLVRLLLENNASQYIPDRDGKFPIDYAGFFKHIETVKVLIRHTLRKIDQIKSYNQNERQWEQLLSNYVDRNGRLGNLGTNHDNLVLMFSPLFHTATLYWASMFDEIDKSIVEEILQKLEAYPEGPTIMDGWRTPCHAASQVGNVEKLKILMTDVYNRYQKVLKPGEVRQQTKHNICLFFKNRWTAVLKHPRYAKLRKFNNEVFEANLTKYKALPSFKYDFLDKFQNTPLHIASQYGNAGCVQMLLEEYRLSIDLRNQLGWKPKDLQQHDSVRRAYARFYKKLDQEIALGNRIPSSNDTEAVGANTAQPAVAQPVPQKKLTQTEEQKMIAKELLKSRDYMPKTPSMVLKVNAKESAIINRMITMLQNQGFQIQMFPALDNNQFYIALYLKQDKLETEAKSMKLKIKLCDVDAKLVFEPNQKVKYEPFRIKDIQKVMITLINNIINTDQLIRKGILLQILPMHDFQGIYEIRTKWENRWFQPIPLIGQLYRESIDFQFPELSSIKNYFGEKIAFHYAWMAYYTAWLLIPAILGLAMTGYQIAYKVDNVINGLFAFLICIWVTIFIERWKRKSSELALRWGILSSGKEFEKQLRPEFNGDEQFSSLSQKISKKNVTAKFYLFLLLSIPIFIILIGICIVVYFLTRWFRETYRTGEQRNDIVVDLIAGIINGASISIVNFTYQQLVVLFVKLENHKYTDTYEKSFIFKLFVFKFVNTNLSLFYTAFNDKNFDQLYYLLVGMIIQKCAEIFFFKVIYKYAQFWFFRRRYFSRVRAMALQQQDQHNNFKRDLDPDSRAILDQKLKEVQTKSVFAKIYASMQPVYQRLVLSSNQTVDDSQVLIDYIELNSKMIQKFEKTEIMEISDVFIMFGLAVLYACACPIACLIVMIFNLIDIKWDLRMQYICIRRPIAQVRANIGPWLMLAEFMALAAVVSNCLLLYFSSPILRKWLSETFDIDEESNTLWIIVGIEHVIIMVKVFSASVIQDIPVWVKKTLERVKAEVQKLVIEENERDENEKIQASLSKLKEFESKNRQILGTMKNQVKVLTEEMSKKDEMLKQFQKEKALKEAQEKSATSKVMKEIEQEKQAKPEELKLIDFIGLKESEWYGQKRAYELEKSMTRIFMTRLLSNTFFNLEKEVLTRRITKLYETKKQNTINCAQCSSEASTLECTDCQDHFCRKCSDQIHSKAILSGHNLLSIPVDTHQSTIVQSKTAVINPSNGLLSTIWKKFEYYNFPLDPGNDQYTFVQKHYVYLKQQYIEKNFIQAHDKINYQGLFVNGNYDMLTETQGQLLRKKTEKAFGDGKLLDPHFDKFNDEELFYMNRIAFYLFRHKGENVTFANFTMRLNILQTAPYQKRVTFWLSILDDKGDETISRVAFDQILKVSYAQDLSQKLQISDIVDLIFGRDEKVRQDQMTINKMIEVMNRDGPVKDFMQCILQYNPQEVIEA